MNTFNFYHYKTLSAFQTDLSSGTFTENDLAFIKESKQLYTHGQYYDCTGLDEQQIKDLEQINVIDEVLSLTVDKMVKASGLNADLSYSPNNEIIASAKSIAEALELLANFQSTGGIPDAPSDGTIYGRQDGSWVEIQESGVGKIDPNSDGTGEIFNDYENNSALGAYSHVEGSNNVSYQTNSHAEGNNGIAFGNAAHVEGLGTVTSYNINITSIDARNVIINYTSEDNVYIGNPDQILRFNNNTRLYTVKDSSKGKITLDTTTGIATGNTTVYVYNHYAKGPSSHVEGSNNITTVGYAHAEGKNNVVSGTGAHVEGGFNKASSDYAHAEGYKTTASGQYAHSENLSTVASGAYTHAEGDDTVASGQAAHAEGRGVTAKGSYSHAEGQCDLSTEVPFFLRTRNLKICSYNSYYVQYIPDSAESQFVLSAGELFKCNDIIYKVTRVDHVGRLFSTSPNIADNIEISDSYITPTEIIIEPVTKLGAAIGIASHHEGTNNCAYGVNSHVGGNGCQATGNNSFVHGENLIAGDGQTVFGKYNLYNEDDLFQIGYGVDYYRGRRNALSVSNDGVTTASRIKTYSITVSDKLISSNNITIGNSTTNQITSASKGLIIASRGYNKINNNGQSGDVTYLIIGESNKVFGKNSITVGDNNNLSEYYSNNSICVGLYNTIHDSQSIAVGYNCTAYGNATVAFGGGGIILTIDSQNATSLLQLYESTYNQQNDSIHVAFAKQSMVTGKNNLALGMQSTANGEGNVAKNRHEFVVGRFNGYDGDTDNLFVVGNGTSHIGRSNILSVNSTTVAVNGKLVINGELIHNNDIVTSGVYSSSDIRLKNNIQSIDTNKSIDLVSFTWNDTGKKSYGIIAQQIEEDYPELVETNDVTGYKTVNYNAALVVKCAQLEKRIEELEKLLQK